MLGGMLMGMLHLAEHVADSQSLSCLCIMSSCVTHPHASTTHTPGGFAQADGAVTSVVPSQPVIDQPALCCAHLVQVYFNESAAEAKEYTQQVLDKWTTLLGSLPEQDSAKLQRSMGLKMEQLKVGDD